MYGGTVSYACHRPAAPEQAEADHATANVNRLKPERLDCQKILARRSQHLTASGRHHHHVLDPHTPFAGEVYSRLDGDDHARPQDLLCPSATRGRFVDLQPYSVAGGMGKIPPNPALRNLLRAAASTSPAVIPGRTAVNRRLLRFPHRLVRMAGLLGCLTHPDRAGLVRAITCKYNTEVTDNEPASGDGLRRSTAMRQSRSRAGRDNRVETTLPLAPPRRAASSISAATSTSRCPAEELRALAHRYWHPAYSRTNQTDFFLSFTKRNRSIIEGALSAEPRTEELTKALPFCDRKMLGFKPDDAALTPYVALQAALRVRPVGPCARSPPSRLSPPHAPGCVTDIREESSAFLHEQEPRAAGKAAEITDVGEMADQQSIKARRWLNAPQFVGVHGNPSLRV